MKNSFVIVLTTWPAANDPSPEELARTLVQERLAACVSVLPPMQSTFWWEGKVDAATEHQILIKTSIEAVDALKQRISNLHPYEVPEILVLTIADGSDAYLTWISKSVANNEPRTT